MCDCKKHFDPKAPCTCTCAHGKTFTDHNEEQNIVRDAE